MGKVTASGKLARKLAYTLPPGPRGDSPGGTYGAGRHHGRTGEQRYGDAWRRWDQHRRNTDAAQKRDPWAGPTVDGGRAERSAKPLPNTSSVPIGKRRKRWD